MSELELPAEAQDLVSRVRSLGEKARQAVAEAREDLATIERRAGGATQEIKSARKELERDQEAFDALVMNRLNGLDFVAAAWADYEIARAASTSDELRTKKHPASSAAAQVREFGKELATARREIKRTQWVLAFYEHQFPWLVELRDLEEEQAYVESEDPQADDRDTQQDPARGWLSNEEWQALSTAERNQRALDRYLKSRKSSWELGRDYERYVGYLREQDGCMVTYHGIFAGLEDLGRDLLAEKDGRIEVIQCKRWAQHKTIHERHIFQLFGTVVACRIENPHHDVTGTFTTTTSLSERAKQFAEQLEVHVEERAPLADYPRIKCNVARADAERIYHLPFDQQYDNVLIEPDRGERWVATVAEAEALGFRRAWRWKGLEQAD